METLKTILRINAASCLLFGAVFTLWPHAVGQFLGTAPTVLIFAVGIVLILNGLHLLGAAMRKATLRLEIIWFSLGDLIWWLASLFLVAAGLWTTTPAGIIVTFSVGLLVATLGIAQLWLLGLERHQTTSARHLAGIKDSWLALPLWVRIWLFFLNAVFLYALVLWPAPMSLMTLIAFVASGPLLMAQMAYDGGLRRSLGLAHLIPWLPLLWWLISRGDADIYSWVLGSVLVICLSLDVFDVLRFWRGERRVMGRE